MLVSHSLSLFLDEYTIVCPIKFHTIIQVKIRKSQNKLMKSSFLPKYEQNILRIFALATKERSNQKNKGTLLY